MATPVCEVSTARALVRVIAGLGIAAGGGGALVAFGERERLVDDEQRDHADHDADQDLDQTETGVSARYACVGANGAQAHGVS